MKMRSGNSREGSKCLNEFDLFLFVIFVDDSLGRYSVLSE